MKYLLILAIALLVLWLVKNKRRLDSDAQDTPAQPARKTLAATEIVACKVCDVHLPRNDAIKGARGVYCSLAHRQQAGDG